MLAYRIDDVGDSTAAAKALEATGGTIATVSGNIEKAADKDWYRFTTAAGGINLLVTVNAVGANLDSVLELRDSTGKILKTASPTTQLDAAVSTNVAAGTYYAVVRSTGSYGNIGTYNLSGSVVGVSAPTTSGGNTATNSESGGGASTGTGGNPVTVATGEIDLLLNGRSVASGGAILFGTIAQGKSVDRTIVVKNTGQAPLTLNAIDPQTLPNGFKLITNVSTQPLLPGRSTSFHVRMTQAVGTLSGSLHLLSDDADELDYVVNLSGVIQPNAIALDDGDRNVTLNGDSSVSETGHTGRPHGCTRRRIDDCYLDI